MPAYITVLLKGGCMSVWGQRRSLNNYQYHGPRYLVCSLCKLPSIKPQNDTGKYFAPEKAPELRSEAQILQVGVHAVTRASMPKPSKKRAQVSATTRANFKIRSMCETLRWPAFSASPYACRGYPKAIATGRRSTFSHP